MGKWESVVSTNEERNWHKYSQFVARILLNPQCLRVHLFIQALYERISFPELISIGEVNLEIKILNPGWADVDAKPYRSNMLWMNAAYSLFAFTLAAHYALYLHNVSTWIFLCICRCFDLVWLNYIAFPQSHTDPKFRFNVQNDRYQFSAIEMEKELLNGSSHNLNLSNPSSKCLI